MSRIMQNSCSLQRMFFLFYILLLGLSYCQAAVNKYSKEANQPEPVEGVDKDSWKSIDKPFRLAKINLIWAKAQKRLTEFKLKSLYSELKVQDKEELQLKRLKADNLDKDGLKEAEIRKKFGNVIERYGLADHFDKDTESNQADSTTNSHSIFKDKKLNKLWLKAESAGFTEPELKMLKDEFAHHQEKVLQYYSLLEEHNSRKLREDTDAFVNEAFTDTLQDLGDKIEPNLENSAVEGVRSTHRELKYGYDRLERMTLSGPKSRDFEEPKVQGLWKIALNGDFTSEELESLRTELRHYEQRLQKLRFIQAQHSLQQAKTELGNKSEFQDANELRQRIKLQSRKVEKLHADLEARITQRHLEL
ncbi:alpha-2-macroglobulin receptor-associated protein-like isoform X1 [Daphnia pulicaria]|uniref:alpha-2-macroglobulin receptor-associated protein-like isoform X1 n=1 Tax=Daphnia pulicaria TaxID=35523 RepID=UPI001EEC841A|nr:alpha-2-macroglobulin receptor-associated protein-like isoform X1 [Daphnia pulicaria]